MKKALAKSPFADSVAYKEYEVLPNGEQKPIDVRDIIAILTAFEREHFYDKTHPINAYRSKAACLQHFKEHAKSYQKIYPLASDILELYDLIQLYLPDLYNKVRGGKFGHLTGVTTYKGKHKAHLEFINTDF